MNVVRPKPIVRRRSRSVTLLVILAGLFGVFGAAFLGYDAASGYFGILPQHFETVSIAKGRIIKVPAGGNVQAAIEQAAAGDIVELQAGAVYNGQINLPSKQLADYVTIRSSRHAELPEGKRVSPDQKAMMATIQSGMLGRAAVSAANGANHYRFVGIEFVAAGKLFNYGVVVFGGTESKAERVPHDLEIDRCYFHTTGATVSRRAIALNSANTTIKNSYIEGFAGASEETQGICGWSGTRNVRIINNYIEGGAENIMFGGSDPDSAEMIPQGIEVSGNHLRKPPEWKKKFTVKTLFELKNARSVKFTGNYLENNWDGSAFRITVRNQNGGAPFSVIEDTEISGNVINGTGDGINILGRDDSNPSQTLKRLKVSNNLFINLGGDAFEGSGYFVQIADGEDVTIANNTVFNDGNIVTFYGAMPRNFSFRDNITGHGNYGIHGPIDLTSDAAKAMFLGNIFMNLNSISADGFAFPDGNIMVRSSDAIGFADIRSGDYRLSGTSKYKGKGASITPLDQVRSN